MRASRPAVYGQKIFMYVSLSVCGCVCVCVQSILDVCSLVDARASPKEMLHPLLLSLSSSSSDEGPHCSPGSDGRGPPARAREMCSCLMSKWLVSLFASEIVKLDIKFYERVPGPVLVSSVLCFLFSPFHDDIGGSYCCCCCSCCCCGDCCHTNLSCACIWSRRKF